MARIAWFSPVTPTRSGISQYSGELLPPLSRGHDIDLFVDGKGEQFTPPDARIRLFNAYDVISEHHKRPYDLFVYQLGNAPCHDYMWAYAARFPGLAVLHDGQLHHARGRMLLQRLHPRLDDYRREFRFNHPEADADLAELGAVGLLGSLTYFWPMLRSIVDSSRGVVVHNGWLAQDIAESFPGAAIDVIEMGVPEAASGLERGRQIRSRHGIDQGAVVFTALGKVTPEKRVREAMRALASCADAVPRAHLLIAGETVEYYDLQSEAEALGMQRLVSFAGYVPDEEIGDYLAASDVCLCMRWPTSRETSASWLRCLAAGKPTISTDLVHTADVPTLDPRNWSVFVADSSGDQAGIGGESQPVGVSIDILDEGHSLKLAIRRLASDDKMRLSLGANAHALWASRFNLGRMVEGYENVIVKFVQGERRHNRRRDALPDHLRATGMEHAESLVKDILGPEYHLPDAD